MIKVHIIAFGKHKDDYVQSGVAHFMSMLKPYVEVSWQILKEEKVHNDVEKVLQKEAQNLEKHLPSGSYLVVLDEKGKLFTSEELSQHFERLLDQGTGNLCLVIGSAHGLAPSVKEKADLRLSLSPLTMNHQLVRPVLLEQLYRIATIQRGMRYHK